MQDWKKGPVDTLAISLYHLQVYYLNEISKEGWEKMDNIIQKISTSSNLVIM